MTDSALYCLKISTIRDSIFYGVIPFFIMSGIQKLYIEIQLSPANIELQLAMHIWYDIFTIMGKKNNFVSIIALGNFNPARLS